MKIRLSIPMCLLFVFSIMYVYLLFTFLNRDINSLLSLGYGIGRRQDVEILTLTKFSKLKGWGFVIIELGLIFTTILLNFKTDKWKFIAFCSFSIPLFIGFFYLEMGNKFRGYEFHEKHLLILAMIAGIVSTILGSKHFSDKIKFNGRDYIFLVVSMIVVIVFYYWIMGKI